MWFELETVLSQVRIMEQAGGGFVSGLIDSSTFVAGLEADGWKTRPIGPNRDGTMASRGRRKVHVYGCGLITLHVANETGATVVQRAWWDPVDAWLAVAS